MNLILNKNLFLRFPIPIHTIPKKLDYILYAERPCDRYDRAFRKYHESREYKEEIGKMKNLIEYLETHSGVMIGEDLGPLHFLYDTLWIENLKNKTLVILLHFHTNRVNLVLMVFFFYQSFQIARLGTRSIRAGN